MTKIHSFDFEYDHDYTLIGIHTVLEDYRLAYLLNKNLKLSLERFKEDLDFPDKHCSFPFYIYEDNASFISWSLITNKFYSNEKMPINQLGLFEEETETRFLIPEENKVDYFLKITGNIDSHQINEIITTINKTNKVITSFTINPYSLKTRDNLIF